MSCEQLLHTAESHGMNLAEMAIERIMDIAEDETGKWPDWTDPAPDWIVKKVLGAA